MATGSGTGTPATIPHQVTADALAGTIRHALDDVAEATFSDAEILSWINEAIKEYSQHLPRTGTASLATVANTRTYSLPWDAIGISTVEYPAGENPPEYLIRMSRKRPSFSRFDYYDFLPSGDLTNYPVLLLSFDPQPAEAIEVTYQHPHDSELTATSYVTVPSEHHHVLTQYVMFAAARQLQANEEAAPTSNSSLLMSQFASNTRRYELAYLNAINRILYHRQGQSDSTSWKMDDYDRVY